MWAILAILLFIVFQLSDALSKLKLPNFTSSVNNRLTEEECHTCGQIFQIKHSNKGKGLFKNCPDCKANAVELGKLRKKKVANAYRRLNKKINTQASAAKSNEYMMNPTHEFERLKAFYHSSSTEKGTIFENYVAEVLSLNGYKNVTVLPIGPDDGIDVVAIKNDDKIGIQCKFYENTKVGNQAVMQFFGALANGKFNGGLFITTSNFTESALKLKFLKDGNISLLNFPEFHKEYILPVKLQTEASNIYRVICENYRCDNLVYHNILERTCKCPVCGKDQKLHVNYLEYYDETSTYIKS